MIPPEGYDSFRDKAREAIGRGFDRFEVATKTNGGLATFFAHSILRYGPSGFVMYEMNSGNLSPLIATVAAALAVGTAVYYPGELPGASS